jgi:hypothetical protein
MDFFFGINSGASFQFRREAAGWLSVSALRGMQRIDQQERGSSEMRTLSMKTVTLTFPELILLAGTRGLLGAGIALLIARRLSDPQRETAGVVLTAIGLLTTVPLALEVMGKANAAQPSAPAHSVL